MPQQVPPNFSPQRVTAYIDGFNLYYGLKSQGFRRYYWLDVAALCGALLQNGQNLTRTKYFTARITSPPDTRTRQSTYLEALQTRPDLEIFWGQYLIKTRTCRNCGVVDQVSEEKMTDVNIAVQILSDAFRNQFDTALILSGDSDLVPPIREVRRLFPEKTRFGRFSAWSRFQRTKNRRFRLFQHWSRAHRGQSVAANHN